MRSIASFCRAMRFSWVTSRRITISPEGPSSPGSEKTTARTITSRIRPSLVSRLLSPRRITFCSKSVSDLLPRLLLQPGRHIGDSLPLQLIQTPPEGLGEGRVQVGDQPLQGEDHHRVGGEIQHRAESPLRFPDILLRHLSLRHVLQRLDGADDLPFIVFQGRRREIKPPAVFADVCEKPFRLIAAVDHGRFPQGSAVIAAHLVQRRSAPR